MVLIVDDILRLPGTIGGIIFQSLVQTVEKVAWTEYRRNLRKMLLRARHDYENNKIKKEQFEEIQSYVFGEMKIAKQAMAPPINRR
jgi:Fe-S cluster biosynthesis and repair protein YggX